MLFASNRSLSPSLQFLSASLLLLGLLTQPALPDSGTALSFGSTGLSSLRYNGTDYLLYGDLRLNQISFLNANGSSYAGATTSSVTVDPVAQTQTRTYSWGKIVAAYSVAGNQVNMTVTVTNNAAQPIQQIWFEALGLKFPSTVTNYDGSNPIIFNTLGQPAVAVLQSASAAVAVVSEDVSKPLQLGFPYAFDRPVNTQFPVDLNTGTVSSYPDSFPVINRSIPAGGTDQYRISLRFGPSGSTAATLAADIYRNFAAAYAPTVNWSDRRAIGQLILATSVAGYPTNPRGWLLDRTIDVTSAAGIAAFQQKVLAFANNSIAILKQMNAQGMITWDIEGEQFVQPVTYIGDPRVFATLAPEMAGIADQYFQAFRTAGFRVGVCLRPQQLQIAPGNASAQQIPLADPTQTLLDKATYAHNRWGATLFYIDSNVNATDPNPIDPAIIRTLSSAFPDSLFIPEHSNTQYYAYSAPYREFRQGFTSTPADARLVYPRAATVIYTPDGPLAQGFNALVAAVQAGDILMYRSWYADPQNAQVAAIYQAATGTSASVSVSVTPTSASLTSGQSQQFAATVTGSSNTQVTWSVSPAGVGSVSTTGLYSAPVVNASSQSVSVIAASAADSTKSGAATVTIAPAVPVAVTVAPTVVSLTAGRTQQFSASVTGSTNTQVVWSVAPAGSGTVSATGLYTAPASVASAQQVSVIATSSADSSKSATASVTVTPAVSVAVTVTPSVVALSAGQTQQFSASVTGSANTQVVWSVAPAGSGTVSSTGLYTAPASVASAQQVSIIATSSADSSKSAAATISLSAPAPVTIGISPSASTLSGGQSQQFTASVTGTTNTAVTWSASPAGIGTLSATGLFTAPASISSAQAVSITATSIASPTKSATAAVTLTPAAASSSCGAPSTGAFTGCYYSDRGYTQFAFSRVDPQINFNWSGTGPGGGISSTQYAVRWQGNFTFAAGSYQFTLTTDDGSRLFVDGQMLIDGWGEHPAIPVNATTSLTAGTHLIRVDYFQLDGGASANLAWNSTGAAATVGITISPASASLTAGQSQQFSAAVTGSANQQVTWSASPSSAGTISSSGLFTVAASVASTTAVTVTAVSAADPAKSATASLTVQPAVAVPPTVAVSVSPQTVTVLSGQLQPFAATVTGTTNSQVLWSISPPNAGSISSLGIYSAPIVTSPQTVTVTAVSVADSSKSASATVTVTAPASSCGAPSTNAFTGCYYSDRSFDPSVFSFTRVDPQINFVWTSSGPGGNIGLTNFQVRWQGNFTFSAGNYLFTATTDDGSRLYIDGQLIIDYWGEHPAIPLSKTVPITSGNHLIQFEYVQLGGAAVANLNWTPAP